MADHAFVVAASADYLPGLRALLNSIHAVGSSADVLLAEHDIPLDVLVDLQLKHPNLCVISRPLADNVVQGTALERFRLAYQEGSEYRAVCLMDADMWLTANPQRFFEVAAAGFIVAASNGMIINFGRAYQEQYQCFLEEPFAEDCVYPQTHTTAPIFLGPRDLDWFEALYSSRRIDSWDDFLFLNLLGIKLGKSERMIVLPPYTFTGIHHWQVKPETSLREKGGLLLSGTEEQVYMIHGKWWDQAYRDAMVSVMQPYLDSEQMGEKCILRTAGAVELIYKRFQEVSEPVEVAES
jgi:hypothetical protein